MKRKVRLLLPMIFLLCACTNGVQKTEKESIKIDHDKDYLYVKDEYKIPFIKEQEAYARDDYRMINTYVININTEEAKKTTDALQSEAMNQIANIKKLEDGYIYTSESFTGKAFESSSYITILIEKRPFIEGSEIQTKKMNTYIFNKKNGKLVSTEAMLKQLDVTNDAILQKVKETYASENKTICTNAPGDCYYEPEIYKGDPYIADTIMYVDDNDNLVIYMQKSNGLAYDWVPITLKLR